MSASAVFARRMFKAARELGMSSERFVKAMALLAQCPECRETMGKHAPDCNQQLTKACDAAGRSSGGKDLSRRPDNHEFGGHIKIPEGALRDARFDREALGRLCRWCNARMVEEGPSSGPVKLDVGGSSMAGRIAKVKLVHEEQCPRALEVAAARAAGKRPCTASSCECLNFDYEVGEHPGTCDCGHDQTTHGIAINR